MKVTITTSYDHQIGNKGWEWVISMRTADHTDYVSTTRRYASEEGARVGALVIASRLGLELPKESADAD